MPQFVDKSGQVFGRLTVLNREPNAKNNTMYRVKCECGTVKVIRAGSLTSGRVKSCGCLNLEVIKIRFGALNRTHGLSKKHPLYNTWTAMRERCNCPSNKMYKYYGERGITVCERWDDFTVFVSDMGNRPAGTSLDRIDNSKGYSHDNCKWATRVEQNTNRRNTKFVEFRGERLTLAEISRRTGANEKVLFHQVCNLGVSIEAAILVKHRPHKITQAIAEEIRKRYGNRNGAILAREYGIARCQVSQIMNNKIFVV